MFFRHRLSTRFYVFFAQSGFLIMHIYEELINLILFLPLFQATACISTLPLPIIWNYAWHPFPWSKLYAFGLHILPHTLHFTSMGSVALVYLPKTLILGLIFVSSSQNCLWLFTTIFPSFLFRHCVYIWTALMRILPEITFYELRKDLIQYCSGFLWGQGNARASVPVTRWRGNNHQLLRFFILFECGEPPR